MSTSKREIMLMERLEKMSEIENSLYNRGLELIGGTDEVGRGPLAGPVVAATVILPKNHGILGINDSKKLSPKKRDELFDIINEKALSIGVSFVYHDVIDRINILNATKQAMIESFNRANSICKSAYSREIEMLLTDAVHLNDISSEQQNLVKGDEKSVTIAAASIIAKVTRDRYMEEMDEMYSGYDFASNKGYGTKKHYDGLHKQGLCPIHRRTFLKNL